MQATLVRGVVAAARASATTLASHARRGVPDEGVARFEQLVVPDAPAPASLPEPAILPADADVPFELAALLRRKVIPNLAAADGTGVLRAYADHVPADLQLQHVPSPSDLSWTYDDPRHAAALEVMGGVLPFLVLLSAQINELDDAAARLPSSRAEKRLRRCYERIESLSRALPIMLTLSPYVSTQIHRDTMLPDIVVSSHDGAPVSIDTLSVHQMFALVDTGIWAFWYQDSRWFRMFRGLITSAAAATFRGFRYRGVARVFTMLGHGVVYMLMRKRAHVLYRSMVESASIDFWSYFWNLQETPFVAFWDALTFPRVAVNQMLRFPLPEPSHEALALSPNPPRHLSVRVLANARLPSALARGIEPFLVSQHNAAPPLSSLHLRSAAEVARLPRVPCILHVHGGGFIAMTSKANQVYTRRWARQIPGAVMFSLDYSLAPGARHPTPINECFAFYAALVQGAFGVMPSPLTLVGDSAGGNLVAAITLRAIHTGTLLPDSIQLMYPAMVMRQVPTPSRLLSGGDPILPGAFISVCREAFMPAPEFEPLTRDYADSALFKWLHPGTATDADLARFPPTRIVVGDLDPLLDDSVDLWHRLRGLGVPVEFTCYHGMPHGFLNYGRFVPGVNRMIDETGEMLRLAVTPDSHAAPRLMSSPSSASSGPGSPTSPNAV